MKNYLRKNILRENEEKMMEEYERERERMMGAGDWWPPEEQTTTTKMAFASSSTAQSATTSSDGSFISLFQRQFKSPHKNRLFPLNNNRMEEMGAGNRNAFSGGGGLAPLNNMQMEASRKMPWRASAANHLCVSGGGGRYRGTGCDWIRNALKLAPNGMPRLSFATQKPMASQMSLPSPKMEMKASTSSSINNKNGNANKFSKWAKVNPAIALIKTKSEVAGDTFSYKKSSLAEMINPAGNGRNEEEEGRGKKLDGNVGIGMDEAKSGEMATMGNNLKIIESSVKDSKNDNENIGLEEQKMDLDEAAVENVTIVPCSRSATQSPQNEGIEGEDNKNNNSASFCSDQTMSPPGPMLFVPGTPPHLLPQ